MAIITFLKYKREICHVKTLWSSAGLDHPMQLAHKLQNPLESSQLVSKLCHIQMKISQTTENEHCKLPFTFSHSELKWKSADKLLHRGRHKEKERRFHLSMFCSACRGGNWYIVCSVISGCIQEP